MIKRIWKLITLIGKSPKQKVVMFLKDYLVWAAADAPENNPYGFNRHTGLCLNSDNYNIFDPVIGSTGSTFRQIIRREYPSNSLTPFISYKRYSEEVLHGDFHKNPLRLEFCDKMIAELEEQNK